MHETSVAAMCQGKDRLTRGQARKIAKRMQDRGDGGVTVYRCIVCHEWHVGRHKAMVGRELDFKRRRAKAREPSEEWT